MAEEQFPGAMSKMEQLAEQKFARPPLSLAERKLMRAAPNGDTAVCGPNDRDEDPKNDPSKADKEWGPEREIRAEVIRWLCVDKEARAQVDPKGIGVYGAKITEKLDLSYVSVRFPIELRHCRLMKDAEFLDARLQLLGLQGSWVQAINADGFEVWRDVSLGCGYHAEGGVRLLGAQIGGNLDCGNGAFVNPTGKALDADSINVRGSIFLNDGFRAEGGVVLLGAQVGNTLECEGGTFKNGSANALTADRINVQGSVFLRNDFRAEGEVRLLGAQIGSDLQCTDSTFSKLTARSATVRGTFWWWGMKDPGHTTLDVRNASVGSMGDDKAEKNWPKRLALDGFVYGHISDGPTDAASRLRWLARQYPFAPQPYRQLAKILREMGDDDGAVKVLEEMERLLRKEKDDTTLDRLESWGLRESIGYGYHPGQAVWEIVGLTALAWIVYRRSYLAGGMVPKEKDACSEFKPDGKIPKSYGRFFPSIYSLENSLPLVNLGQFDKWQPDPEYIKNVDREKSWPAWLRWLERSLIRVGVLAPVNLSGSPSRRGKWIKCASRVESWPGWLRWLEWGLIKIGLLAPVHLEESPAPLSRFATSPRFVRWFLWIQILLGWLLATLFLAGVTGIVRKD